MPGYDKSGFPEAIKKVAQEIVDGESLGRDLFTARANVRELRGVLEIVLRYINTEDSEYPLRPGVKLSLDSMIRFALDTFGSKP